MKVSVIIPVYNGEKTIVQNLTAVMQQNYSRQNFEIIVVDDGSKDSTSELLKAYDDITVISQTNRGPAAARNNGARCASGEILVFTDSDTIPHQNWLSSLIATFEDSSVMAASGTYTIANKGCALAELVQKEIESRHSTYGKYIKFAGTYNLAVRRSLFEKISGFNETYTQASGEDNDLCYKILRSGHEICYVSQAKVAHHHPECLDRYLKSQFRHGFWRAKLYLSHPARLSGDSYTGLTDAAEVFLCMSLPIAIVFRLFCANKLFANATIFILFAANIVLELFHGLTISTKAGSVLYAAAVFYLRSIARTTGLIIGILHFRRELQQG